MTAVSWHAPVAAKLPCDMAQCNDVDTCQGLDHKSVDMADIDQSDSDDAHETRGDSLVDYCHSDKYRKLKHAENLKNQSQWSTA